MTASMDTESATDAFHVDVRYGGLRRIIDINHQGSRVAARIRMPSGDAPPAQIIATGDYHETADLGDSGDLGSAVAAAMKIVADDIRDDLNFLGPEVILGIYWDDPT